MTDPFSPNTSTDDYVGLNIEIQPGYDRFVQSADPAIQAQLLATTKGDLVRVVGVVKNKGGNIRILSYTLIKAAVSALETVQADQPAEVQDPITA